jgi:hypothetical protein
MISDHHGFYHAIPLQSGSIALRVRVEDFGQHSLLPLLNVFGRLYHGTINKKYFNQLFQEKKQQFLAQLKSPDSTTEKFSDFRLRMIRLALTVEWKWPAFVNVVWDTPEWATGGGRILATGMCKKNPELALSVLFFNQAEAEVEVDQWLDQAVEVIDDQQLHRLLNVSYITDQSPTIQISSIIRQINNRTCLFLHGIIDDELEGYQHSQEPSQLKVLHNLQQWQATYPYPQLEIYTDWPELLQDSLNIWNYQVVGNISQFQIESTKPGRLEKLARIEHTRSTAQRHVMYIRQPRLIDLSEFLIWVDNEHTTFISQDWDFLLYRHDAQYKTRMISFNSI